MAVVGVTCEPTAVDVVVENRGFCIGGGGSGFSDLSVELFGTAAANGVGDTDEEDSDSDKTTNGKNGCYCSGVMEEPDRERDWSPCLRKR